MSIAASMLPELDMEMKNTRRVLERLPESKFEFKPDPKSFSLQDLGTHVANMIGWGAMTLNTESFDVAPVGQPPMKFPPFTSVAAMLETFDRNVVEYRTALAAADDAAMMKPWSLLVAGNASFTMPRAAVLRSMIMNHLIHHRAQLTVYLRLLGEPVPALYGPSADESN